jgi:hypothetical protein
VTTKEKVLHLCASGKIAINVRGLELLQAQPGETEDTAWMRMRGKLGSGKELEQTILQMPGAHPQSGGTLPFQPTQPIPPSPTSPPFPGAIQPSNVFGDGSLPATPTLKSLGTTPKTPINLLGEVEKWGISAAANVMNVNIKVSQMTGAQLTEFLKKLPDGLAYSLNLETETQ